MQVIITKDGQEDRPLAAAFVDMLQSSIGASARERQKRAHAQLAPASEDGAPNQGVPHISNFPKMRILRYLTDRLSLCGNRIQLNPT